MKKIYKALHLPIIYLTAFAVLTITNINAESSETENTAIIVYTPEQQALAIFNDFFTHPDPNHHIEESFGEMCRKAIPLLKESKDQELQDLARVLENICNKKNLLVIGAALTKFKTVITRYLTDKVVDANILKKRIIAALSKN